jgi:hypothetical protein
MVDDISSELYLGPRWPRVKNLPQREREEKKEKRGKREKATITVTSDLPTLGIG